MHRGRKERVEVALEEIAFRSCQGSCLGCTLAVPVGQPAGEPGNKLVRVTGAIVRNVRENSGF
jgi:hypothetical protein